jgi:hypothetical protein
MTTVQLDPADLAALRTLIDGAGDFTVSYEPADLKVLPGVWIRVDAIDLLSTLADGHTRVPVTLHLVTRTKPIEKALGDLLPMLDAVCSVLTPAGDVTITGVVLPGSQTPMPALAVPYELRTIPTEEAP